MPSMLLEWIGIIVAIVIVDLALSGDNALVIGAAAAKLQEPDRRRAILFGGGAAIVLRILLTFVAVLLLRIPFVETAAGIAIFIIAILLLRDPEAAPSQHAKALTENTKFVRAMMTIIIADLSMSLDNVLAIAALARQNYVLLAIGLLLSIVLLMVASSVIALLIARFSFLLYVAGIILAWTAAAMVLGDTGLKPFLTQIDAILPIPLSITIPVLSLALFGMWAISSWNATHNQQAAHRV